LGDLSRNRNPQAQDSPAESQADLIEKVDPADFANAVRTTLRLRACIPGTPWFLSAREMADSDTPHC
jgi:hypothetical protein